MKKSKLHREVEINEYLPKLEKAQRNFTLLAAGEVNPDEISELSLKDLAAINMLIEDLKDLKNDLAAEQNGCQGCNEKDTVIKLLQRRIDIQNDLVKEQKAFIKDLKNANDKQSQMLEGKQQLRVCK